MIPFFPIPENSIQANLFSLMQRDKIYRISEDGSIYWINTKNAGGRYVEK